MADAGEDLDLVMDDTDDEALFDAIGEDPGDIDTSGKDDPGDDTGGDDGTEDGDASDGSKPSDKPSDKTPAGDKAGGDGEQPSAADKLADRSKAWEDDSQGKVDKGDGEPGRSEARQDVPGKAADAEDRGKAGSPPASPSPTELTAETVTDYLGLVSNNDLPDKDIKVGNETVNLKAFAADFPDVYGPVKVVAAVIAQKMMERALADGRIPSAETIQAYRDEQARTNSELEEQRFWGQIGASHPDWQQTIRSQEFNDWLGKQSPAIQRMAKNMRTPDDGIAILDSYAEAKNQEQVEIAREEKKKKDDLLSGVARNKKSVPKGGDDDLDEEALFNKIADKDID